MEVSSAHVPVGPKKLKNESFTFVAFFAFRLPFSNKRRDGRNDEGGHRDGVVTVCWRDRALEKVIALRQRPILAAGKRE